MKAVPRGGRPGWFHHGRLHSRPPCQGAGDAWLGEAAPVPRAVLWSSRAHPEKALLCTAREGRIFVTTTKTW